MKSFFDKNYQTPEWYEARQKSRRQFLKSAAVVSTVSIMPVSAFANIETESLKDDPWRTLNAVLNHLLPASDTGPGAEEIQALNYLYVLITEQPIEHDEKDFIKKGVGWLNGFTQQQHKLNFSELNFEQKETALRGIARSRAGENWISTLLSYIFEAMLAPSSYGGNPDGVGWKWLEHQAGFPMPDKGKRYFELPGQQIKVAQISASENKNKASS